VIKSLGEALGTVKGVSGGAIMGDGKVSLILDIPGLVKLAQAL
jgi:two-component system, chemotaxis family, sensor kinase CheA